MPISGAYYDLVTTCHSFIANGFAVHNCEINDGLLEEFSAGGVPYQLPNPKEEICHPDNYGLPCGQLVEWYYRELLKKMPPQPQGGSGEGGEGEGTPKEGQSPATGQSGSCATGKWAPWEAGEPSKDAPGISKGRQKRLLRKVAEDTQEHQRSRGNVPQHLQRWAESITTPKVNWRKELSALTRSAVAFCRGRTDYSYRRPSHKSQRMGVVMPGMQHPLVNVAIGIDTSGSMGAKDLGLAVSETAGILKQCGAQAPQFMCIDAEVSSIKPVRRIGEVDLSGGGGTDMRVAFDACLQLKPLPDIFVLISDCYTPWPERTYPFKTIICATQTGGETPPAWAKVVQLDDINSEGG